MQPEPCRFSFDHAVDFVASRPCDEKIFGGEKMGDLKLDLVRQAQECTVRLSTTQYKARPKVSQCLPAAKLHEENCTHSSANRDDSPWIKRCSTSAMYSIASSPHTHTVIPVKVPNWIAMSRSPGQKHT